MFIIVFIYQPLAFLKLVPITWKELLLALDLPGVALLIRSLTCFFLALEWGGATKLWTYSEVIGTFIGWILLMIAFGILEWRQGERALSVGRIMRQRTMTCRMCCSISNNSLIKNLPWLAPYVSPDVVLSVSAYDIRGAFSGDQLMGTLLPYMIGLKHAWIMSTALSAVNAPWDTVLVIHRY
ncbi:hypothetical protein BDV29DRAFT_156479 [Aspergillus leporis]|uniref:Uncharacterized protein n=1 Tax=Aspergillus leporis TaxID=41062 RepID=A0A5N5X3K7_9EURO|nr:hypothetical protein BDV29DRAFT_156479 [Aspergillus leporis]